MDNKGNTGLTGTDQNTMHNAGVDLDNQQEEFVDIDSTKATENDKDLKSVGLKFVDNNSKINKEDLSSLKEEKEKALHSSDLEKEFTSTMVGRSTQTGTQPSERENRLNSLLEKIKEKLGIKKTEVRKELDDLKRVKEDISKDIENIKELEESEQKIEKELDKINLIKKEVEDIEKEVEGELSQ